MNALVVTLLAALAALAVIPVTPATAAVTAPIQLIGGSLHVGGSTHPYGPVGDQVFLNVLLPGGASLWAGGLVYTDIYQTCADGGSGTCVSGAMLRLSFGGSLDCLPLNLVDQFGNDDIIVRLNTLWTMVVAAAPVGPLPEPGPDFAISTPFTLTIITPQGQVYVGSGIADATLSWNTDSGEWETDSINYVVQKPASPPPPPPPAPQPRKHPRH